jgi:hypothetical protein
MKNSGGDAINESFLDCFSNWGCKFLILSLGGRNVAEFAYYHFNGVARAGPD